MLDACEDAHALRFIGGAELLTLPCSDSGTQSSAANHKCVVTQAKLGFQESTTPTHSFEPGLDRSLIHFGLDKLDLAVSKSWLDTMSTV